MKKLILLPLAALLATACNSFQESVKITSQPEGADVYINGDNKGQTPMNITLNPDISYEIVIAKVGYKPQTVNVSPAASGALIKFGPLVDMGYYKDLFPSPVDAELTPDFLPKTPGTKPFEGMTYAILQADSLLASGKISKNEHTYMLSTISKFYAPKAEEVPAVEEAPKAE